MMKINQEMTPKMQRMRQPLPMFFLLAYAISWIFWLPPIWFDLSIQSPVGRLFETAGNFGPFISALILIFFHQGASGIRMLRDRLFARRVPARWYLVALLGPFALMAGAVAASMALGGPPVSVRTPGSLLILVPTFVRTLLIAGGLNEETGWRGYALPHLLAKSGAFRSSVLLGVLWGVWHAPLYVLPGTGQNDMIRSGGSFLFLFAGFVAWCIALSILFTWLHEMAGGSLLIAILFHAAVNTAASLPFVLGVQNSMASLLYPAFTWLAAILVSRGRPFARIPNLADRQPVSGGAGR
jgi:membrane protease YdiL (CAAX protease family)